MAFTKSKNNWALFLLILAGIVLGGFVGELTKNIPVLNWMSFGNEFGLENPVILNLGVIVVTFGLRIKITIASIIGVVIATHDVDFAWRFADRILIFHEGKILADGDPFDIFTNRKLLEKSGLIQPTLVQIGIKLGWKEIPKNLVEFQKMSL